MTDVATFETLNSTRFTPGQRAGHYESFYQRANHPTRPLAFWIRYTIFNPRGRPDAAIGELWTVFFDGETGRHVVAKEEHRISECYFDQNGFEARVGSGASLTADRLEGTCSSRGSTIVWDLTYSGSQAPLFLLPARLYETGFPKAKSLVGLPLAVYRGTLMVNGRAVDVDGWVGSQNHNWGSQHTDYYAFGQVAGFDDAPGSFLETITAQARLGPARTPMLTFLVLRHGGTDYSFVSLRESLRAKGRFGYFDWRLRTGSADVQIDARITAPREAFVGLNYYNPPGGIKNCLNTKIASCELTLTHKPSGRRETLHTQNRALFEILTDDRGHGIPISA